MQADITLNWGDITLEMADITLDTIDITLGLERVDIALERVDMMILPEQRLIWDISYHPTEGLYRYNIIRAKADTTLEGGGRVGITLVDS